MIDWLIGGDFHYGYKKELYETLNGINIYLTFYCDVDIIYKVRSFKIFIIID